MNTAFIIILYFAIGILGRFALGYKGIIDTILWPISIPCALFLTWTRKKKEEEKR